MISRRRIPNIWWHCNPGIILFHRKRLHLPKQQQTLMKCLKKNILTKHSKRWRIWPPSDTRVKKWEIKRWRRMILMINWKTLSSLKLKKWRPFNEIWWLKITSMPIKWLLAFRGKRMWDADWVNHPSSLILLSLLRNKVQAAILTSIRLIHSVIP